MRYTAAGLFVLLSLSGQAAKANVIAYEGFDYSPGSVLLGNGGGTGFSGPWAPGGYNAFININFELAAGSVGFQSLVTSGNHVATGPTTAIAGVSRTLASPLGADGTTTYFSVVLRPDGALTGGTFDNFFGLTLETAGEPELYIGKPGGGALTQYVVEDRGGAGQVTSGFDAVLGQAALLVLKAQFGAGPGGNDLFTLYVNPIPGGPEPLTGAVKDNSNIGEVTGLTIYSTGAFSVDELRVGTTFADVTPAGAQVVPLPAAAWGGLALLGGLSFAKRLRRSASPA